MFDNTNLDRYIKWTKYIHKNDTGGTYETKILPLYQKSGRK